MYEITWGGGGLALYDRVFWWQWRRRHAFVPSVLKRGQGELLQCHLHCVSAVAVSSALCQKPILSNSLPTKISTPRHAKPIPVIVQALAVASLVTVYLHLSLDHMQKLVMTGRHVA